MDYYYFSLCWFSSPSSSDFSLAYETDPFKRRILVYIKRKQRTQHRFTQREICKREEVFAPSSGVDWHLPFFPSLYLSPCLFLPSDPVRYFSLSVFLSIFPSLSRSNSVSLFFFSFFCYSSSILHAVFFFSLSFSLFFIHIQSDAQLPHPPQSNPIQRGFSLSCHPFLPLISSFHLNPIPYRVTFPLFLHASHRCAKIMSTLVSPSILP